MDLQTRASARRFGGDELAAGTAATTENRTRRN
jgi:hypothetical protein